MTQQSTDPDSQAPTLIEQAQPLIDGVKAGNQRAIARSISAVENSSELSAVVIDALHKLSGKAYLLGITGPPGAGKSTLVAALVKELRKDQLKVGVIAVDPTSPYSGGALLGDRVRMDRVSMDDGVFIRSMATRGSLGGLSRKTVDASIVLDAAGFEVIIIETVGVGQSEVDIASTADTTVVVLSPEAGDGIQAMKAGLMEVGNIFCVNKSDRDGADRLVRDIQVVISLPSKNAGVRYSPAVVKTMARTGQGVDELVSEIRKHESHLKDSGQWQQSRHGHTRQRVQNIALDMLAAQLEGAERDQLERLSEQVLKRELTPYAAAKQWIQMTVRPDQLK